MSHSLRDRAMLCCSASVSQDSGLRAANGHVQFWQGMETEVFASDVLAMPVEVARLAITEASLERLHGSPQDQLPSGKRQVFSQPYAQRWTVRPHK